ncbi:hypothetical protein [Streptomyces sp. NPDC102462]|uniref:hypothetical protein n=1 Tax=Streptomyces sp. NPDC102462 TaxID=3366178 RepID=UPI0037FF7560
MRDNPYAEREAGGAPSAPAAPQIPAAPRRYETDSPWGQFLYALVLAVLMGALVAGIGR